MNRDKRKQKGSIIKSKTANKMINARPSIYYTNKHIYLKFIHVLFSRNILKNDLNRIQIEGQSELCQAKIKSGFQY